MNSIRIQTVSRWSIALTFVLTVLLGGLGIASMQEFQELQSLTEEYITCEDATGELEAGSNYLTEQVRLFVLTGEREYMEKYVNEAEYTKRREKALEKLQAYFEGSEAYASLEEALAESNALMETELYAIRLEAEATGVNMSTCPDSVREVELSEADLYANEEAKREKAEKLVSGIAYQRQKSSITEKIEKGTGDIQSQTREAQRQAEKKTVELYGKLALGVVCLLLLMIEMCLMVRKLIVKPLVSYNTCIQDGVIFPVVGAAELQNLALTYNKVYEENMEAQRLIRHEAEYDALTDLMNRGSFDRVLEIYQNGESHYALLLIDVDTFKSVNDTYGHACGDKILQKVAGLLKKMFRSIDFVCRIGGDEFAVVMVEMTSDLGYTIEEKIETINQELSNTEDGLPKVSVSVGVAFSDRQNPGESIFKDADAALYRTKENGKRGCTIY